MQRLSGTLYRVGKAVDSMSEVPNSTKSFTSDLLRGLGKVATPLLDSFSLCLKKKTLQKRFQKTRIAATPAFSGSVNEKFTLGQTH